MYMKGHIRSYDATRGVGLIDPDEGTPLGFQVEDVVFAKAIAPGRRVKFAIDAHVPYAYDIKIAGAPRLDRSRIIAAVLAIVLGVFGAHKFYLGYTSVGFTILIMVLGFSWTGIIPLSLACLGVIEGILYLSQPDETFQKKYLVNRRYWL